MTVNTVSPAIISRAEFNLNAGQTKTPQLVRMDFTNLVTNGTFDTDLTGWTVDTASNGSVSQSTSAALVTSNGGTGYPGLIQATTTVVGKTYTVSADWASNTTGFWIRKTDGTTVTSTLNTTNGESNNKAASGSALFSFEATSATSHITIFAEQNDAGSFLVDNVTLYEADPSDDAPWLRLPYGYSVGRTGMIVRDGVILHPSDYTEVKDSGQTWIKPLVSPGASTEFSIWGSPSYAV